ncbi:inactive protein RESTRICTED TEV MOVEMENT 2-like [Impatiens glandulifera]|uniref:inactive protein RESTRICTED TEV MOVEMENT 2-like n=1 Tax=Impatiens glandulifera TaxID=253017 RepID=UPI001FB09428|nr:inactive protein RESTRICTED TEV MOVEMENT 2-like [Impatiens glandulifera]
MKQLSIYLKRTSQKMSSNKNTTPMSRGGVRPVYEVFKPMSEWNEEEQSDILLLYLPGFMKEQIRVSTEGVNTLRIQGERLVAGNKWNRFEEDFRIPDRCNLGGIHAKVQGGVLIITMPKKIEFKQPNDRVQQQQKPLIQEPVPVPVPKPKPIPEPSQRVQEESKTKSNNLIPEQAFESSNYREGNVNNLNMPKFDQESGKEPKMTTLSGETKNPQKGIIGLDKETDKTDGINFQQAIRGLGKRSMNEERQLLVNMGAAILVIVTFGAYLFSGNAKL